MCFMHAVHISFLHLGFGHVEMRHRLFLLGGVCHLGDHFIHLLHMGVVAQVLTGRKRGGQGVTAIKTAKRDALSIAVSFMGWIIFEDS